MTAALSVVLVAPTGARTIGRTLRALQAQTRAAEIQLVVVAPAALDAAALGAAAFAALEVVVVGPITRRGAAAAAGVRAASAPIVGLIEDHSFPEPGWAAALLAAHAGPWAGVGPVVENANPATATSRVTYWLTYGTLSGAEPAGARSLLPWHNSAYKRTALAAYAPRLADLLDWEGTLQQELLAAGHALYLEPAARTHHVNVSRPRAALALQYHRGRLLGAERAAAERWSRGRRLGYAAAFPLFPAMQLRSLVPLLRRLGVPSARVLADAPALGLALAGLAVGEATGYLRGRGGAVAAIERFELERSTWVAATDLPLLGLTRASPAALGGR